MATRIWVERSTGLPLGPSYADRVRHFPGMAHEFIDCTNSPAPTIDARPRSRVVLIDDVTPPEPMTDPAKPPYVVPSMDAIRSLPWNGFNAVSTFSGCGGSSLGYRMAGFKLRWASEFIPAAQETYRANAAPYTILDGRDVRDVLPEDILSATGLGAGEIDLFDGSPPCASFSTAGKRHKGWGEVKKYSDSEQRTDDLFFEYARLIEGTQPKVFVAENVSGLVKGTAKGYFIRILERLRAAGYVVSARLLDAQWLGVPQARQRIIFVGVRRDLAERYGVAPVHPTPLPYRYSIREALPWLDGGEAPPLEPEASMRTNATGREWKKTPIGGASEKYFQLVRPDPEAPCPTVTAAGGNAGLASVAHPFECRKFSIAELRRLCGFPDDFVLTGTYQQQWERLGRSVPPVMMSHIAATVRDEILRPIKEKGG